VPMSSHVKSRGCRLVELKTLKGSRLSRNARLDEARREEEQCDQGRAGTKIVFWVEHGLANCRAPRN
jgi:hypothetical protein